MRLTNNLKLPSVERSGFEPELSDDERSIQDNVHRFALEVMRPIGRELDRMTAEEAIAPGSPYWTVYAEAAKLGLDADLSDLPPQTACRIECLIAEELGWGDAGLAVSLGAGSIAQLIARASGNKELIEMTAGKIGCWAVTQPDRGSDVTSLYAGERHPGSPGNKGNLSARVSGDEIVINGQSSAWVSNGAVAQVASLFIAADYGKGYLDADGHPNGVGLIVPLDLPGVSRGKPLEKLGQRALPQGEIYFDNVRVPRRFAVCEGDAYYGTFASSWSYAGTFMGQAFTGVARAAFELALAYAHERRQGGVLLAEHQLVQYRLGKMARGVEIIRAVSRRCTEYSRMAARTHPYFTAQGKVTCTNEAFEVVNEALQMFGGAGLTNEFPLEKIFRDTRAALIEDGENHVLTLRFGGLMSQLYKDGWTCS